MCNLILLFIYGIYKMSMREMNEFLCLKSFMKFMFLILSSYFFAKVDVFLKYSSNSWNN